MFILASILLIIGLSKLLSLGSIDKEELYSYFSTTEYSVIKGLVIFIIIDAILEVLCSLYILLC